MRPTIGRTPAPERLRVLRLRAVPTFTFDGQRLAYTVHGDGPRVAVLLHGLLFSQRMHESLARALAERGHRIVTLDLLGHGESDRPQDMWRYAMPAFGRQVVALLDHVDVSEAVVLGTSLGANVALEVAVAAPERVRGMVIEMPVLDNALLGCALAFTPLMVGLTFGEPVARAIGAVARAIPTRRGPFLADVALDTVRQDPAPSAAVLHGLFFGRVAPHRTERRTFQAPTLVIGHRRDPVHPFSDSGMLVDEMPNARLLEADSIIELRMSPERLTGEIADFLDECWKPRRKSGRPRGSRNVA
jgi:pimeloyl-ACP methyl ester carboxylesterase